MMRLSGRWLVRFECDYYTRFFTKPNVGSFVKHRTCNNPNCRVTKVRDRDKQPDLPKIY